MMITAEVLGVILGIIALISALYKLFQLEAAIYKAINKSESVLQERINVLTSTTDSRINNIMTTVNNQYAQQDKAVSLLQEKLTVKTDHDDLRYNGVVELVNHKFNRLHEEFKEWMKSLNDIQNFLMQSSGFKIRGRDKE